MTPLNPTLYTKTGVYRGIHYFFLFLLKNIDCGYSLEPPHRVFLSENFQFLEVNFSIYLYRLFFVMRFYVLVLKDQASDYLFIRTQSITKTRLFKYIENFTP